MLQFISRFINAITNYSLVKLIIRELRWIDAGSDSQLHLHPISILRREKEENSASRMVKKCVEILQVLPVSLQQDFISSLPDIVTNSTFISNDKSTVYVH